MPETGAFAARLATDEFDRFTYIEPPFSFNAPAVWHYPPEVSGFHLLECLRQRLGWVSFAGKKVVDLGCGVRFARTIVNLNLAFGLYVGIDVNRDAITWLQDNVTDARFQFAHLNVRNALYNPDGASACSDDAMAELGLPICDAACMFSVITHQTPQEAAATFRQLRRIVADGGRLYFTAFADPTVADFAESRPEQPGMACAYNPDRILNLAEGARWRVDRIFAESKFQQTAFVCTAI